MDEMYFMPASIWSGANFNVYPQFSPIKGRVASLKDFFTASTKRLLRQSYYTNIKVRLRTHNIYTKNLPPHSQYVTIQITNWTLNPNKKIRLSCSWTVSIIIAFLMYASFTTKRWKVVFCLDTNSAG